MKKVILASLILFIEQQKRYVVLGPVARKNFLVIGNLIG